MISSSKKNPSGKLEYKFQIPSRDVDTNKELKLSAIFAYFQDIASDHSEIIGAGIDKLANDYGIAWILMRVVVEIERWPSVNEEITISTWPFENSILYERDFTISDSEGNIIIRGASNWILMDLRTRTITKKKHFEYLLVDFIEERSLSKKPSKIRIPGELAFKFEKTISFSDLDYNKHLNNAKYLDYVSDCLGLETHKNYSIREVEINYMHEEKFGNKLALYEDTSMMDNNTIYIQGKSDDGVLFVSKLVLKEK